VPKVVVRIIKIITERGKGGKIKGKWGGYEPPQNPLHFSLKKKSKLREREEGEKEKKGEGEREKEGKR
jgi:hypothetical protein